MDMAFDTVEDFHKFGRVMGCVEAGWSPTSMSALTGLAAEWEANSEPAQKLILKAAHDLLCLAGQAASAPAYHLKLAAENWTSHSAELADHVVATMAAVEQIEKRAAIPGVISGAGDVLKAIGYGSIGAGAGLGGLYWLLSRHSNQEEADIEAKKHQVEHYERLARELEESMRRKYRYS